MVFTLLLKHGAKLTAGPFTVPYYWCMPAGIQGFFPADNGRSLFHSLLGPHKGELMARPHFWRAVILV